MNVGLFMADFSPESGGGCTFEYEIFRSILDVVAETSHSLFLLSFAQDAPPEVIQNDHVEFVRLCPNSLERLKAKLKQIAIRMNSKSSRPKRIPAVADSFSDCIHKAIFRNAIEFILYLSPLACLTRDIPYAAVVLDLQHRIQPYFTEISANGEWENREEFYSIHLRRASVVIVGTKAGKSEVELFYQVPSERIKILPHPTPKFALTAFHSDEKPILDKFQLPEKYLLYPAQFWPHKNHISLLLAIELLRKRYGITLSTVFVGSDQGNLQYIHQTVNELGLSSLVYFLGFVTQKDLVELYRNAFALAYLTFFGPENLPPLEAFALGCPVIASNVSGAQEQLGDAALLVDPRDEEKIAEGIKSLLDDPGLRQTLIQRGLSRASAWTGRDFAKSLLSILDEFAPIRRCWNRNKPY